MELNKTKCLDCGHLNRWHSFKWASTPERRSHNRLNNTTCPQCRSTNVENVEDDQTMGPYRTVASKVLPPMPTDPETETTMDWHCGKCGLEQPDTYDEGCDGCGAANKHLVWIGPEEPPPMTDPTLRQAAEAVVAAPHPWKAIEALRAALASPEKPDTPDPAQETPRPGGVTLADALSRLSEENQQKVYDIVGPCDGVARWNVPTPGPTQEKPKHCHGICPTDRHFPDCPHSVPSPDPTPSALETRVATLERMVRELHANAGRC